MRTQAILLLILTTLIGGSLAAQTDLTGTHGTVVVNGDSTRQDAGVVLRPKSSRPSAAIQFGSSDGKFVVFNAANAELLRVRNDGNVGIGVTEPRSVLHLVRNNGNKDVNRGIGPELLLENNAATINDKSAITFASNGVARAQIRSGLVESSAAGTLTFATGVNSLIDRMTIGAGGDTHIMGGSVPLKIQPDVGGGLPIAVEFQDLAYFQALPHGLRMNMPGNSEIRVSGLQIGKWSQPVIANAAGGDVFVQSRLNVRDVDGHADLSVTSGDDPGRPYSPMLKLTRLNGTDDPKPIATFAFWIDPADNALKLLHKTTTEITRDPSPAPLALLTIEPPSGTRPAQLSFNGAIVGAVFQDLAEWVPSTTDVPPGTVVVLNPGRTNEVMASERAYDVRVAGVISAQPGLILGPAGAGKEMVATTGRVRVKVDATQPIRVGDLLVSSSKPGMAMKSEPLDLGGVAIHRPGTIIGKALEPLQSGEGEILVLLSLQ